VLQHDFNPTSIIFQRLKAQESLNELARQRTRIRFANNVRTIWSERTFLVRISALGLMLGALVAFLIPARYTSATRLMPPDNQSGSSIAMAASMAASHGVGGFGAMAGDLLGFKSTSDVFVGILNSTTVQNHIIKQFDLKRVYGVSRMEAARQQLSRCVGITIDRKSQMITISVSDHSPQRAADMAAAFADQLNRLVSELSTSSARRERIFLEGRLSQVNQDLENAEKEFSQFSSKNNAIDIKEQGKAMLGIAGTLQGQLMSAQSELEGLRQIYSDSNVRVRALRARVTELQSQLGKLGGKGQASTLGPDTAATDLYPSIRKLPLLGVTYADLYRRTKVQETVYEVLTQEYELAKVQEAREIPTVKILDPPELPEAKDFPPRTLIAVSTAGLGCLGGICLVLATKSWNEMNPDDLGKAITTEILIDLKEKRFLNSVNTASHKPEAVPGNSLRRKRGILSFLGLNSATCNGNGSYASSGYVSESELAENQHRYGTQSTNGPAEI
jgi:capsule polysaccharide export protein KpsE/RkpR